MTQQQPGKLAWQCCGAGALALFFGCGDANSSRPVQSPSPVPIAASAPASVVVLTPVPPQTTEPAASGETAAGASSNSPASAAPDGAAPAGAVARAASVEGTLVARQGKILTIDATAASAPAGAKGVLYRRFGEQLGGFSLTGWLAIADVKVKEFKDGKLVLTIEAEKSDIRVNGKKVDHFQAGTKVKLEMAGSATDPAGF